MIAFLHGRIAEKQPTRVVIEVGGVGYEVFIPLSSYDRLPPPGGECRLLTIDHVREDCHQLFGFTTEEERRMFLMLMSVTGIGPKIALSSLSGLTVRELKGAIVNQDVKRLSSVSGIGKKTAERIVVELRDKIDDAEALEATARPAHAQPEDRRLRDAVLALIALGYKQDQARKMVQAALQSPTAKDLTVEDLIKAALGV